MNEEKVYVESLSDHQLLHAYEQTKMAIDAIENERYYPDPDAMGAIYADEGMLKREIERRGLIT